MQESEVKKQNDTISLKDYMSSVKSATPEEIKKEKAKKLKKKTGKDDWKKYSYPNRKMRRQYEKKGEKKYELTDQDKKKKLSPFQKMAEKMRDNIEHGKMMHDAFINEVANQQMQDDIIRDNENLKSLIEAFGPELGNKKHQQNKMLRIKREDKKLNL